MSCAASTWPPPPVTWRPCAPPSPPTWSGPRWPASPSPAPTAPPTASPPTSWRSSAADWDGWTAHDDTYVVDGENVVVLARYTATNKATGKHINVRVAHHFVVRGGLIVRFEQFVDTALVRDAAT